MRTKIIPDSLTRKEQFFFFKDFEEPFWGVTAEVDCSIAYLKAKELQTSFSIYYLHKSILAVNAIEAFRYRIEAEDLFLYDRIGASSTVDREDGTFGFSHIGFYENYTDFELKAREEFARVRGNSDLIPGSASDGVVHYSSIPWIRFTSLSHARSFQRKDSVPKISFGKMTLENGKRLLPVSIHVHHSLVDGRHVGAHIEAFQTFLNE